MIHIDYFVEKSQSVNLLIRCGLGVAGVKVPGDRAMLVFDVDDGGSLAVVGRPSGSSAHLGPEFVVTSSLTKAYGLSGLRCGWAVADPDLARRVCALPSDGSLDGTDCDDADCNGLACGGGCACVSGRRGGRPFGKREEMARSGMRVSPWVMCFLPVSRCMPSRICAMRAWRAGECRH